MLREKRHRASLNHKAHFGEARVRKLRIVVFTRAAPASGDPAASSGRNSLAW